MEQDITNILLKVFPFALVVNILVDLVKNTITKRPPWLLPLACIIFSAIISAVYFAFSKDTTEETLYQCFSIAGVSYFFHSVGGYSFLKDKFMKVINVK